MAQQNADWLGLKDRVCVVTGAGGGIGRAVALGMAEAGASVVLLDKDEERCRGTAEVLRPIGAENAGSRLRHRGPAERRRRRARIARHWAL